MGITLAKLTAVTVDGKWQPTYLDGYQQSIHKVRVFMRVSNRLTVAISLHTLTPLLSTSTQTLRL